MSWADRTFLDNYNEKNMAWGRLALLQAGDDEQALSKLAEVFGYARLPDVPPEHTSQCGETFQLVIPITVTVVDTHPKRLPARFPRINKIVNLEAGRDDSQKPGYLSDPDMPLHASDAPQGTYRFAAPEALLSMAHLLPFLFNGLAQAKSGHDPDYRLILRRIEQGRALQRLPKRQRRRWPQRLQIIVDASERLEPHWADFELIVRQLQKLLGKEAVAALRFDEPTLGSEAAYCLPWPTGEHDPWRLWQAPPPDVAVLILGDLGVGDFRAGVAWQRQLSCLQNHPSPLLVLSPAHRSPDDPLFCRQFRPTSYNDYYHLPRHPGRTGFAIDEPAPKIIDRILTWLAPLPLIDAGLLRRLRIELQWGDSALETLIWNHPDVRDLGLGIRLQPAVAERYRKRFLKCYAGRDCARLFWDIVNQHHKAAYQGLRHLEKFNWSLTEQQDDPAMREYFRRVCASGLQSGNDLAQQQALRLQCRTILASLPQTLWNSELSELAYHVYAVAHEDEIRAGQWPEQLAPGFNPDRLQWLVPTATKEKQGWQLVQIGDQGQIKCELRNREIHVVEPLFQIEVAQGFPPRLTLTESGKPVTQLLQNDLTVTLPENTIAIFETRGSRTEIEAIYRPSWASRIWRDADGLWTSIPWLNQDCTVFWQVSTSEANGTWRWPAPFGEDAFGLYVDLSIKNVTQRFRWIEPGTFWMGSPENEPEREWSGNEGGNGSETLHRVTLTQGFWMADTAVSQTFWQAVMSDNPSNFKDNPENPVEQVSWQDAQVFIDKLNSVFPGLQAKLPSEAQWEYACRAGTSTPFSFGVNITPEQVNYDGEYPYADGGKGLNRQRTVPVKSLPANPWGLYEMHGNVWEWCADVWQQQLSAESVSDPLIMGAERDSARVVRGGSWDDFGGGVRSAIRDGDTPDNRYDRSGFRLALGHAEFKSGWVSGIAAQEPAIGGGTG